MVGQMLNLGRPMAAPSPGEKGGELGEGEKAATNSVLGEDGSLAGGLRTMGGESRKEAIRPECISFQVVVKMSLKLP